MTATAVAPDPTEAPPPPEERANIASSSCVVRSSAGCWISVSNGEEDILLSAEYGYEMNEGRWKIVDLVYFW